MSDEPVERTAPVYAMPGLAYGIPVPEREELLTAPEGTLADHVTAEALRRPVVPVDEGHIERGTE